MAELAGYTSRVSELFETMEHAKKGEYQKKLVSSVSTENNAKSTWMLLETELLKSVLITNICQFCKVEARL